MSNLLGESVSDTVEGIIESLGKVCACSLNPQKQWMIYPTLAMEEIYPMKVCDMDGTPQLLIAQ